MYDAEHLNGEDPVYGSSGKPDQGRAGGAASLRAPDPNLPLYLYLEEVRMLQGEDLKVGSRNTFDIKKTSSGRLAQRVLAS